ncbi:hypothetical protein LEP1GSC037_3032 [Leptospira interrogans str. 2006001854]|uniref:Uncharacterized protein n=1 Tax=Leptospira interrogans str. 2006001854 TaxID=1001590 RepID=M6GZ53_LEPIR|nr:hypothetical protein LEP1GSC037_3032 [Leptospira interrogans str. 2006001854]
MFRFEINYSRTFIFRNFYKIQKDDLLQEHTKRILCFVLKVRIQDLSRKSYKFQNSSNL